MYTIKRIVRVTDADRIRSACIRNEWCDWMTCREYDEFLASVPRNEPITDTELLRLAECIVSGTYRYANDRDHTHAELLENVVFGILSDACFYSPRIVEA